jgi:hypothetical protein
MFRSLLITAVLFAAASGVPSSLAAGESSGIAARIAGSAPDGSRLQTDTGMLTPEDGSTWRLTQIDDARQVEIMRDAPFQLTLAASICP